MPIYLLDTTRQCVAAWSRHCSFLRIESLDGKELLDDLIRLTAKLQCRPALFLTSDQSVVAASTYREQLQRSYRLSLPPPEIVTALADKSSFHTFAEQHGLPVPRGLPLHSASDIHRIVELTPPVVIKPSDKRLVLSGALERAVRAATLAEAQAIATRMLVRSSGLIVQEWVDGPDNEIYFVLFSCHPDGTVTALFCGRKLVCTPPAIGSTALCVAAPEVAETLSRLTLDFINSTNYRGLGSLEFKRNGRSGQFLVIEPTVGRTDWQEEIATLCGPNVPLLTYYAETKQPPGITNQPPRNIAWRASREVRPPKGLLSKDTQIVDGVLRYTDPLPAAYYYGYERLALRIWRRAFRRI
jgi:predicted ATP-grasp superfamily ATP-dependent carboligase